MRIEILEIPHKEQRYNTVGDWILDSEGIKIYVSKEPIFKSRILVMIHEVIEALLCVHNGISDRLVDTWDLSHQTFSDPGSLPECPYQREHNFAEICERICASVLSMAWEDHENNLDAIWKTRATL